MSSSTNTILTQPSLSTIYLDENSCLIICKLIGFKEINFNIIFGDLQVKLLFGNLTINEYSLKLNESIELFADKDSNLNCKTKFNLNFNLNAFKHFVKQQHHQFSNRYVQKEIDKLKFMNLTSASFMILRVERNSNPTHLKYSYLLGKNVDSLNWIKLEQNDQNAIALNDEWCDYLAINLEDQLINKQVAAAAENPQIVMVCGGKNSGKSTLLKQLINRQFNVGKQQLNENRKIYYLDLDPGQSEFTNSGQISLIEIDKPILFPTYINVDKFKGQILFSCSVSSTNVEDIGLLYSENLAYLWSKIKQKQLFKSNDLLFVNTMGFVRIIGFMMLVDAIKLLKPNYLIEIRFELPEKIKKLPYDINYSIELNAKNVQSTRGWLQFDLDRFKLKYNYLQLQNTYGQLNHFKKNSKSKRINSQLVYLSLIDNLLERPLNHLEPYAIKFKDIKIYLAIENRPEERLILDILNCSWIQLCKLEVNNDDNENDKTTNDNFEIIKTFSANQCLGNAFIRNIDLKNRLFYILTPECLNTIRQVNCFVKSNSINVPKEIFIQQLAGCHSSIEPQYIDVKF